MSVFVCFDCVCCHFPGRPCRVQLQLFRVAVHRALHRITSSEACPAAMRNLCQDFLCATSFSHSVSQFPRYPSVEAAWTISKVFRTVFLILCRAMREIPK